MQNDPPASPTSSSPSEKYKSQLEISPGAGHALHRRQQPATAPFKNVNLRKAFWAAYRTAMDKARGGKLVTEVSTHFIYPTIHGFEQSGGAAGPKFDFNEHLEGDMAVAEKYMKLAGYPSGKYTGKETLADRRRDGHPPNRTRKSSTDAEEPRLQNEAHPCRNGACTRSTATSPKKIDVCPNVGWIADFGDPQAVLNMTFNGKLINATGTSNWGQANDPINAAMEGRRSSARKRGPRRGRRSTNKSSKKPSRSHSTMDKQANIEGNDVNGVGDLWNSGTGTTA